MTEELIEYRVRPVTRFIVTRYERSPDGASSVGSVGRGEFDNGDTAYHVAYALAKADHERKGWAIDDPRIQYPRHPDENDVVQEVDCQRFSVPVGDVLDGARELCEVAVVGIAGDGEIIVSSSMGTPQTLALFASAPKRIEELGAE